METRPGRSILKDSKTSSLEESVSGLRDDPNLLSKLLADCPQITPSVLAKLSPEEWDQVVSFACASLGKSLQLIKKLSDSHTSSASSETTTSGSNCSAQKHVTISDTVSTSLYDREPAVGGVDPPTHERHRHRRRRRDRPTSLPPTYLRDEEPHPPWSEESEGPTRARAHSHESQYYHRCSVESSRHRAHKSDPSASRSRRKKPPKSQRNPDAPVDVSLDDNCPGVARVRRVHRHTHHHSLCSHYTERGGSFRERRAIKDQPSMEDPHSSVSESRDDKSLYLTLGDMQTVLRHSAEVTGHDLAASYPGQGIKKRPSFNMKSKHGSLEEDINVSQSGLPTEPVEGAELNEGWNDLVCPSTSRSGRDSPATDMAVFNLDLNHPSMLVPLRSKKLNNNHTHHSSPRVLLHSHNHYHHIIHHTPS